MTENTMWINPNTDKGWTDTEEAAFTVIVQASYFPSQI